ncbi:hypothetical protein [Streptomyces sp. NPDC101206]|uniref:hypothetical protein n=1 Tax=Streptomyces sp. NPDC101206 TaxID=3366128 RepID=UPI00380037D8
MHPRHVDVRFVGPDGVMLQKPWRTAVGELRLMECPMVRGDHLPVITPPATTPVADKQERPQPFPLGIAQITPPHVRINDLDAEQSHDRPDKS